MTDSVGPGKLVSQRARRSRDASRALARLVRRETGVEVDPSVLGKFLVKKFRLVSALAHQIHDEVAR